MAPSLLRPQGRVSPEEALELARQAPAILRNNPRAFSSSPLSFLFSATESTELWIIYENLLLACLRTGDLPSAHECLQRLVVRFGGDNERIMAFEGLVREAEASSSADLDAILEEYKALLKGTSTNIPIAKRRVALLRSLGRHAEAITALNELLDYSPTDAESWSELSELYLTQGLYPQAVFALEEVLVLTPNAWNMHARLGEVLFMSATASGSDGASPKALIESLKRFCRSVELCDDYLRGYYGLRLVTDKLLAEPLKISRKDDMDGLEPPDTATLQKLNQAATSKLAEIVRRHGAGEKLWQGYDAAEVEAARELLSKTSAAAVR